MGEWFNVEKLYTGTFDSPVGRLCLAWTDRGLLRLDFGPQRIERLLGGGAFAAEDRELPPEWDGELRRYFGGEPMRFTIPLDLRGTAFEREVWAALQTIPYGRTKTYAKVAAQIGRPGAARAVGGANGKNPVSVVVPCHRVVAANSLGGYGAGIGIKRALLDLEARGAAEGYVV